MPPPDDVRPAFVERRVGDRAKPGGRRAGDPPTTNGWSTGQLAYHIGMSRKFVIDEIKDKRIVASLFGREWRIAASEVRRYCESRGYPVPDSLLLRT